MLGPRLRGRKDTVPMALTHPATISPARPANSAAPGALAASAAVICLNEAACIGKCLQSLNGFAEIIVVDSGSTDGTLAIVDEFVRRGFPIRLINQAWLGYARQKQLALDEAREPWVFSIDADEWLDDDLRASLPRLMAAGDDVSGWKVRRSLTLYGQSEPVSRLTRPEHILRLVRRGRARFDPALIVHEGLVADEGETPIARHGLLRHERSLPLDEQMKKEIVYARLKAEQRLKQGRKPSTLKLLFSPPIYFLRIFFWNRFFLMRLGGVHPRRDRRHVFADDRGDSPPAILRPAESIGRSGQRNENQADRNKNQAHPQQNQSRSQQNPSRPQRNQNPKSPQFVGLGFCLFNRLRPIVNDNSPASLAPPPGVRIS